MEVDVHIPTTAIPQHHLVVMCNYNSAWVVMYMAVSEDEREDSTKHIHAHMANSQRATRAEGRLNTLTISPSFWHFTAFIIPLLMVILLGNRRATFPEMDFSLWSTCSKLHCVNLMAMLLLVGLIVGGIDGDGVGFHALPASSSAETFIHSSSVHSSWFGFLLSTCPWIQLIFHPISEPQWAIGGTRSASTGLDSTLVGVWLYVLHRWRPALLQCVPIKSWKAYFTVIFLYV